MKARPRLMFSALVGILLLVLLPQDWRNSTRMLIAWDTGTGLYLILAAIMMARSDIQKIRLRAELQDEGRFIILISTVITTLASLAAIIAELATAKSVTGHLQLEHIGLAGLTVFLSWTFMQTMFALHYAHEYYMQDNGANASGLDFPGGRLPDYWDFVYFSFVIGTAAQTADVNVTSRTMCRIVTLHCMVAFFFNTTILALTVNIGAGLF